MLESRPDATSRWDALSARAAFLRAERERVQARVEAALGQHIQNLVNDSFELDPDKECHSNPANREKYEEPYLLYCRLSDELRRSTIFPAHRKLISG